MNIDRIKMLNWIKDQNGQDPHHLKLMFTQIFGNVDFFDFVYYDEFKTLPHTLPHNVPLSEDFLEEYRIWIMGTFDNNFTLKYKAVKESNTPVKYLGYNTSFAQIIIENYEYHSMYDIYMDIQNHSQLEVHDYINLYIFSLLHISSQPLKQFIRENNLLESINYFLENLRDDDIDYPNINNNEDIIDMYNSWLISYNDNLKQDLTIYNTIISSQSELVDYAKIKYVNLKIISKTYLYKTPEYNVESGISIFDYAQVSYNVPFIQFIDTDEKNYYKLFEGNLINGDIPKYELFINEINHFITPGCIYIIVLIQHNTHFEYVKCEYNLIHSEIRAEFIEIEGIDISSIVKQQIIECFSNFGFEFDEGDRQINIRGNFELENFSIEKVSLHYLILVAGSLNTYLYINESKNALCDKTRVNIHYRSFNNDTEKLSAVSVTVVDENGSEYNRTNSNLKISVNRAESEEELYIFINIFSRLMGFYNLRKSDIISDYQFFLPENVSNTSNIFNKHTFFKSKQQLLSNRMPHVYFSGYARDICTCEHQPIVIQDDEVAEWQDMTYTKDNKVFKREVMVFPPLESVLNVGDPRFNLVCPNDNFPIPSLAINSMGNKHLYPAVPCCGKTRNANQNERFKWYLGEQSSNVPKETSNRTVSTLTMLNYGGTGDLEIKLSKLLKNGVLSGQKSNLSEIFSRYGVGYHPSSLITCIIVVFSQLLFDTNGRPIVFNIFKNHMKIIDPLPFDCQEHADLIRHFNTDSSSRQLISEYYRVQIGKTIHPEVYKQELFDFSLKKIQEEILNCDKFLDPYLYYRGVEEYFNINLYVFNPEEPLHPINKFYSANDNNSYIEIPRSKNQYIKLPALNRQNILILKHFSSKNLRLAYPVCDLIISSGVMDNSYSDPVKINQMEQEGEKIIEYHKKPQIISNDRTFCFDDLMGKFLYKIHNKSLHPIIWTFENNNLICRDDPYNKIDWTKIFQKYLIIGQHINADGKLRKILLSIDDKKIMVCLPPSQPLNCPQVDAGDMVDATFIEQHFPGPSEVSENGLWYKAIDIKKCIFIPCVTSMVANPKVNILLEIDRIRKIKKYSNLLLQLIYWLWCHSKQSFPNFWKKYCFLDDTLQFNIDFVSKITRVLPEVPEQPNVSEISEQPNAFEVPEQHHTNTSSDYLDQSNTPTNFERANHRNHLKTNDLKTHEFENDLGGNGFGGNGLGGNGLGDNDLGGNDLGGNDFGEVDPVMYLLGVLDTDKWWPDFFRQNGIYLYGELYEKIYKYFSYHCEKVREAITPPKYLSNFYTYDTDFSAYPRSVIFIDKSKMTTWVKYCIKKGNSVFDVNKEYIPILTKFYLEQNIEQEPILILLERSIYIIQNIKSTNILDALAIAYHWKQHKINLGYYAVPPPIPMEYTSNYVLYNISISNAIVPVFISPEVNNDFFQILNYNGSTAYAAMLPLVTNA